MHPLALVVPLLAVAAGVPLSEPVPGPAPRNQLLARAASDGENYLAVWMDHRSTLGGTYATRVSRDGEVLDPLGIPISDDELFLPQVIWSGTSYVITWSSEEKFWLMRIDRDGKIVDGPRVLMTGARPYDAATDGTHVVISYLKSNGIAPIPHALFLTPDAQIVADVALAGAREIGAPEIAFNGTTFGAVWLDVTGTNVAVDGVRFTIAGVQGSIMRLVSDPKARMPRLVSDGRDFLLLTYDDDTYRNTARRVRADFATLGSTTLLPESLQLTATAIWTGSHYAVVADYGSRVDAVRLDREGRLLGDVITIEHAQSTGSSLSATATTNGRGDLFVAWASAPAGAGLLPNLLDIYGAVVNGSTLVPRSREMLSVAPPRQEQAAVASSGNSLLTVWQEESGLYARRNALDGRPLDAAPLRLAEESSAVAVAFNGKDFVVAWTDAEDVLSTRRVPASGALRAEGGASVDVPDLLPTLAIAADRGTTLLAWASFSGVHTVRLREDAAFLDPLPLTLAPTSAAGKVAIAAGGDEFLVVWDETFFLHHAGTLRIGVQAARVTRGLTSLGAFKVVDTGQYGEGDPAAAWNGREWLVVWNSDTELRGRRIARNGTLRDGVFSDNGVLVARDAVLPALAWQGGYVLAWTEASSAWRAHEIRTAWLADLGASLTAVRSLGTTEPDGTRSAFVPLGGDRVAVVFTRLASEAGGVPRAFLETFGPPRRRAARH